MGGLADASIERIVALRPDLVLLGPRPGIADRLAQLGIAVQPSTCAPTPSKGHAARWAAPWASRRRAESLIAQVERELDPPPRLPAQLRGRSVRGDCLGPKAASEATFIGETLARLGLVNIVGAGAGLFPRQPQFIVRRAPDLIIGPAALLANLHQRPAGSACRRAPPAGLRARPRAHGAARAPRPAPGRGRAHAGRLPAASRACQLMPSGRMPH